jgi:putative transposase
MGRNSNFFAPNEFFHSYNRGVEKRKIFLNQKDIDRFLMLLYVCNSKESIHLSNLKKPRLDKVLIIPRKDDLVHIGAYCLMPNHFHLLLRENIEGGVSLFMQKLLTGYTMYFNKKYDRSGSLFQGTFKASHCDNDNYLKYLFAYIHLNPLKIIQKDWKEKGIKNLKEAKKFLESYSKSSYLDYIKQGRIEGNILSKSSFPEYFKKDKDFDDFIDYWISYSEDSHGKV